MRLAVKDTFFRGVAAGFSAPYRFAYGRRYKLSYEPRDFVSLSWEKVGTAIRSSIDAERNEFGQGTQSRKRKPC